MSVPGHAQTTAAHETLETKHRGQIVECPSAANCHCQRRSPCTRHTSCSPEARQEGCHRKLCQACGGERYANAPSLRPGGCVFVCLFLLFELPVRLPATFICLVCKQLGGICPGWQPRDAPTGDVRRGLHSLQAASTGFGTQPLSEALRSPGLSMLAAFRILKAISFTLSQGLETF